MSAEIDARLVPHDKGHDPVNLGTVAVPPMILAPRHLLSEPDQVRAGYVMVMSDLRPAHPGEETLGIIHASAVEQIGLLVIDPL